MEASSRISRDRVATAVFQAIIEAEIVDGTAGSAGLDIAGILDGLTLVGAALLDELGVGASEEESVLIIGALAETTRRRLHEVHAFRRETGCTLFEGSRAASHLTNDCLPGPSLHVDLRERPSEPRC